MKIKLVPALAIITNIVCRGNNMAHGVNKKKVRRAIKMARQQALRSPKRISRNLLQADYDPTVRRGGKPNDRSW